MTGTTLPDRWRRFAAVDVFYPATGGAVCAVVVSAQATFAQIERSTTVSLDTVAAYQPGRFSLRELPAIRAGLAQVGPIDLLIVDGYVTLDAGGRPGLGAYAHEEFAFPVIGVAKTAFHSADHAGQILCGAAT